MNKPGLKSDLKNCVTENLGKVASVYFLKRALSFIETSHDDRESLWEASCRVSRMTELFIDTALAEQIRQQLRIRIEDACNKEWSADLSLPIR